MPTNTAAWVSTPGARLEVRSAPYTAPDDSQIVVKNGAVAINPIDWVIQTSPGMAFTWIKYPFILGFDLAGEVIEVGKSVTRFKIGDRVVAHACGTSEENNNSAMSAFQEYTVVPSHMASPIPKSMSYEQACVIPLGVSTAACGLFQKDQLGLQYPAIHKPKPTGQTLLIWGGSTSVGCNAIQLAVAAGYEVFTTCSPKNFDLVKKLGATKTFDYNSSTVIPDLIAAFEGKTSAGALTMGFRSAEACMDVLHKCNGNKFIAMATYPLPEPRPTTFVLPKTILYFLKASIELWWKSKTRSIGKNYIFGSSLINNGVGKVIYEDFLPDALAKGSYIAAPEPYVAGKGLEYVQDAMDLQKKGVSAKKVVVSL